MTRVGALVVGLSLVVGELSGSPSAISAPVWQRAGFSMIGTWELEGGGLVLVITGDELSSQKTGAPPNVVRYAIVSESANRVVIKTLEPEPDLIEIVLRGTRLEMGARGEKYVLRFVRVD